MCVDFEHRTRLVASHQANQLQSRRVPEGGGGAILGVWWLLKVNRHAADQELGGMRATRAITRSPVRVGIGPVMEERSRNLPQVQWRVALGLSTAHVSPHTWHWQWKSSAVRRVTLIHSYWHRGQAGSGRRSGLRRFG